MIPSGAALVDKSEGGDRGENQRRTDQQKEKQFAPTGANVLKWLSKIELNKEHLRRVQRKLSLV